MSQDPDQIARERAEKEFERDANETPLIKYTGNPTYAILDIERQLKIKSEQSQCENITDSEILLEGYNRPMMEVLRKKRASQSAPLTVESEPEVVARKKSKIHSVNGDNATPTVTHKVRGRPRKLNKMTNESTTASTFTTTDESSSSSEISAVNSPYKVENFGSSMEGMDSSGSASDEFSSVKTRHNSKPNGVKVVKTNPNCLYSGINGNSNGVRINPHHSTDENDEKLIGARRRKRNVPKKSNGGVTKGELVV